MNRVRFHLETGCTNCQMCRRMKQGLFQRQKLVKRREEWQKSKDCFLSVPEYKKKSDLNESYLNKTSKNSFLRRLNANTKSIMQIKKQQISTTRQSSSSMKEWFRLKQVKHRPKFERWEGKLVKKMIQSGKIQRMLKLMV